MNTVAITQRHLGCFLFLEPSNADPLDLLPVALDAVAPSEPITLVADRSGKGFVRKYLGAKSVRKAWDDPMGTTLLCLNSVARNCYDPQNHDYSEIGFKRGREGVPVTGTDALGEVAVMRATPFAIVNAEHFVRAALCLFESTASAQYCYIHCASDVQYLRIEASVLPGNPMIPETIEHTHDRLVLTYPKRAQVGEKIIGAHWGVMLSKKLLDQLGGRERVQRESPVHQVRHLENGAAFLQLTEVPLPLDAPEMLRALPAFEAYLEPISLPIGPYFRRKIPLLG